MRQKVFTGIIMRKYRWIAGFIVTFTITVIKLSKEIPQSLIEKNKMKYILQWTSPHTDPFFRMGKGQEPFLKRSCRVNNCYITPKLPPFFNIYDIDAILFYGPEFCQKYVPFPEDRSPKQKYVYASRESSVYYNLKSTRYDGFFNWTYTYKLNSDIYFGFIVVKNKKDEIIGPKTDMHWLDMNDMKPIDFDLRNKLKSKKLAAAWFVSNCETFSGREKVALNLQKLLKMRGLVLDIYSDTCTWKTKSCPKDLKLNSAGKDCLRLIETDYYFYLAFENSRSEDYVTEKLLHAVQNYAVPIVFGGANYTRFLPDGSYLDAGKLSMKNLVNEIVQSIVHKELYYDYFKWTNHYSYHSLEETPESDYMCMLCSAINDVNLVTRKSIYTNLRKWCNGNSETEN